MLTFSFILYMNSGLLGESPDFITLCNMPPDFLKGFWQLGGL